MFVSIACSSQAQVLFESSLNTKLEGIFSNDKGQQVAARFPPTKIGETTHVTWYGYWSTPQVEVQQQAVTEAEFKIRFFSDSSGAPAATPLFDMTVKAKAQATQQRLGLPKESVHNGRVIFRYDADVPSGVPLDAAKPFWLSISASGIGQWLWAKSAVDSSSLKYRNSRKGLQWNERAVPGQTAFTIEGKLSGDK